MSIGLHVTCVQHARLIQFCQQKAMQNVSFDSTGMLQCYLPTLFSDRTPHDQTFCSRYVTEVSFFRLFTKN